MKTLNEANLKLYIENENALIKYVAFDLLANAYDYNDLQECAVSVVAVGCVADGKLIYSDKTIPFFNEFKSSINELLAGYLDDCGGSIQDAINQWDPADPLALEINNQAELARFGYDAAVRKILNDFKIEY